MIVREAEPDDSFRLAELAGELNYSTEVSQLAVNMEQIASDTQQVVLVVEEGADIAGWLHACRKTLLTRAPFVEIEGLIVSARYRRKGLGKLLISSAETWAREKGCDVIIVRSNVIRKEAHAFYPGVGFQLVKEQKVYKKDLVV